MSYKQSDNNFSFTYLSLAISMERNHTISQVRKYLTAMMAAELTQFTGRDAYCRVADNKKHRNGSYYRSFTLKNMGEVKVKVPREQSGDKESATS